MTSEVYQMQWQRTLRILGLLVATLATAACGSDSDSSRKGVTSLKLLWIPKELNNEVFWTGRAGALVKAEELSKSGGPEVEIIYKGTESATDVSGQADILRSAKALNADGVAISCNSAEGLKDAIDQVVGEGIPVMTFDSDSPESKRFTYLGVDNEKGGKVAARILGKSMADTSKKKVAVISGVSGAANLEARVRGFRSAIKANFPELELLDTVYCNDDGYKAASLIERLIDDNSDLGGFFFVGLWPLFTCNETDCTLSMPKWSAAAKSSDVKTVVFDTLDFELKFVENGMVSGLVGQKYWGWGYDAVRLLNERIVNRKTFPAWTDSGLDVVCPNNVEEMDKMWSDMSFAESLSPCVIAGEEIK